MPTLHLPEELTIYAVGELHPHWRVWVDEAAAQAEPATVDGSAVDQIDGAGLQLVVSLSRTLAARGVPMHLVDASTVLRNGCTALGLDTWLAQLSHPTPEAA
jgi:anti-anti-sigma regulatory factor